MSDQIRAPSSITRIQPMGAEDIRPMAPSTPVPAPAENASMERLISQAASAPDAKPVQPDNKAEAKPQPKPAQEPEVFRNLQLHFRVDPDTHDITVLMVDAASKRVIRSIPPEELGKLSQGELVEMLA